MEKLFDLSEEYDAMLNQGLRVSGESKEYFALGRIKEIIRTLPPGFNVSKILDYGCGIGDTSKALAEHFPNATIVGSDLSENAIEHARSKHQCDRIKFIHLSEIPENAFDLAYVNGVFHHIPLHLRDSAASQVSAALKKNSFFAFFENNPWNPGTRYVMSRIAFDRDARTLSYLEAQRLLSRNGFSGIPSTRFLFYFPRVLKALRPLERYLASLPLGAQYLVMARK